jgi:hypothetical protein
MATAHIHNFLKRNTYSADVYKPPGSFDHEADGKVVEGSRRNMDTGNRSALFPIKNMPRRSSAYAKEVKRWDCTILPEYFMTRKLYVKFILTVLNVSRGSSLSTRNAILLYTNHVTAISFICPCEMNLSYWLFFITYFWFRTFSQMYFLIIFLISEYFYHISVCYNYSRTYIPFPVPRLVPYSSSLSSERIK